METALLQAMGPILEALSDMTAKKTVALLERSAQKERINETFSRQEVAELLRISTPTLTRMIRAGKIPQGRPVSLGDKRPIRRWLYDDFKEFIPK